MPAGACTKDNCPESFRTRGSYPQINQSVCSEPSLSHRIGTSILFSSIFSQPCHDAHVGNDHGVASAAVPIANRNEVNRCPISMQEISTSQATTDRPRRRDESSTFGVGHEYSTVCALPTGCIIHKSPTDPLSAHETTGRSGTSSGLQSSVSLLGNQFPTPSSSQDRSLLVHDHFVI